MTALTAGSDVGRRLSLGAGGVCVVGRVLASGGGQGVVYEVEGHDLVLKRYRPDALAATPDLQARLAVMLARPPASWREPHSGHVVLAWPHDLVFDGSDFVGFVMPRIDPAFSVELHVVSNPSDRRSPGATTPGWVRGFSWRYLLQAAANLALAVHWLHADGYVIGDFNERNVFVTQQALVTLIDCDSIQVPGPGGGVFRCVVGRPEFTAPELLRRNLRSVTREPSSDLFALAVHLHQLLLQGAYPFDGVWRGAGERPSRSLLAARGSYVRSRSGDGDLVAPAGTADESLLPAEVRDLFDRAFDDGARDPDVRPSALEWHERLKKWTARLATCGRLPGHVYPNHHSSCPWCELELTSAAQTAGPGPDARTSAVESPHGRPGRRAWSSALREAFAPGQTHPEACPQCAHSALVPRLKMVRCDKCGHSWMTGVR